MKCLNAFVACGLVGSAASLSLAQPFVINISGATLLENFVNAPGSTADFIDVNGNGITFPDGSGFREQLAPTIATPSGSFAGNVYWLTHYRNIGSINGLRELIRGGRTFITTTSTDAAGMPTSTATRAFYNRTQFINNGAAGGPGAGFFTATNPGGFPWRSTPVGTVAAPAAPTPLFPGAAPQGLRVDVAPLDVPASWGITYPNVGDPSDFSQASYLRRPGQIGYGINPSPSKAADGSDVPFGDPTVTPGSYRNFLAELGTGTTLFSALSSPSLANGDTLFDNPISFAPIAPFTNRGTGLTQIKMSDLRHLAMTGRMSTGENFVFVTRDVGSGTHNGMINSIGLDPAWGVGENIGAENVADINVVSGPSFIPGNKGGSGALELAARNHKLAISYTGAERTVALMSNNRAEVLGVQNDVPYGGTAFVRPTSANIVQNTNNNTWVIGGPASLVTFGSPLAESLANGGEGAALPRMRNPQAAGYVNNIRKAIDSFTSVPGGGASVLSPGELAATQFILPAAQSRVPSPLDATILIANPALNPSLQTYTLNNNVYNTNAALFATFNTAANGRSPFRASTAGTNGGATNNAIFAGTYSDGLNLTHKNQAGVNVSYGTALTTRNRIAGDFNNDQLRTLADVPGMIAAWRDRNGGPAWDGVDVNGGASDTSAIIEVLGDFTGDGNFNSADVRYFADGLSLVSGALDRKAGFIAVDNAFAGNFFGTTKANGVYANGDSRADIAGPKVGGIFRTTPGYNAIGSDGTINGWDLCYVQVQFKQNPRVTDNALNWSNLGESVRADLSADINGDLIIDQNDVTEILTILGTVMGDVNLDGTVNAADRAIIDANLGQSNVCWQDGDLSGNGTVGAEDIALLPNATCSPADVGGQGGVIGGDGTLDNNDFAAFITLFFANDARADVGSQGGVAGTDGAFDNNDFAAFITLFFGGCL